MVYRTKNSDLATFLVFEGMKLIDIDRAENDPRTVILVFDDPQARCPDLEIVYLRSEFKTFRDINKQILSKIHQKLKEL